MSAIARNQVFAGVHTIGGLLPTDMLIRIAEGKDAAGTAPADYHVPGRRTVRDEAERHWDYLKGIWRDLRRQLPACPNAEAPSDPTGTAVTNWLEPLFNELGFGLLTPSPGLVADDDPDKTFPISHQWNHVPIHLAAWNADLDRRGEGTVPPQSLVQESLNRTNDHLWGVLSNGRSLRLLRDSSALATASYVEFDLEAIFDGELFSEFVLLFRLLHVSRFQVPQGTAPSACWLERWRTDAITSGTRALDQLRLGVQAAITTLGTGFLRHPNNRVLRETLNTKKFHTALLRLVYRMLFVFVAENREALHSPEATEQALERYARYFSTSRLREHARRRRGTAHEDLYRALRFVIDALGDADGRPELGLPGLGGIFDDTPSDAPLHDLCLSNEALLTAVRYLSQVRDLDTGRWRNIDYRHLDAEELGSIYESLLELVPQHSATNRTFELVERAGNIRKSTSSYYTPTPLIDLLLDETLDPVIDDAVKRGEQRATAVGHPDPTNDIAAELLSLKICDPACGSGHFLLAAARRVAKRLAAVRERNPEPILDAVRHALHEVVERCLYGVDLNDMAVELAKVSLWLEALEPGRPLGFLDAHIKCGNSLIGATPVLLKDGIPDAAFKSIEGDDKKHADALQKINRAERTGQRGLFELDANAVRISNTAFARGLHRILTAPSNTLRDVRRQADAYEEWKASEEYVRAKHIADAWCAAFMWKKTPDAPRPVTHEIFTALQEPDGTSVPAATHEEIVRLRNEYKFFHWHLEFPDIFTVPEDGTGVNDEAGWTSGFDCVIGNPPWDKVDFEDKKYFSVVEPAIAEMIGAARRQRIREWVKENPELGTEYNGARRRIKAFFHFAGDSGIFPLCAQGLKVKGVNSLQTDHLFAERFAMIAASSSRYGAIIPTTIATGAGAQHLLKGLTGRGAVRVLYGFENRKKLFPAVDSRQPFSVLSLVGEVLREPAARFAFLPARNRESSRLKPGIHTQP